MVDGRGLWRFWRSAGLEPMSDAAFLVAARDDHRDWRSDRSFSTPEHRAGDATKVVRKARCYWSSVLMFLLGCLFACFFGF